MRLLVLGDSHSAYSFCGVKGAKIFWRGPVTMHRAARDGIASLVPPNCIPATGDVMVLSFGEIDCRVHIEKQAKLKGRSAIQEADDLCDRFGTALNAFSKTCPAQLALACIVPFNPQFLELTGRDLDRHIRQQSRIRDHVNERLRRTGFPFVDFRSSFSNEDGTIIPSLSDRNFHINSGKSQAVVDALNSALGSNFKFSKPFLLPLDHAQPEKRLGIFKRMERYVKIRRNAVLARLADILRWWRD